MCTGLLDIKTRGSNIIWHNSICVKVGIQILSNLNKLKSDPAFTNTYVKDHLTVSPKRAVSYNTQIVYIYLLLLIYVYIKICRLVNSSFAKKNFYYMQKQF